MMARTFVKIFGFCLVLHCSSPARAQVVGDWTSSSLFSYQVSNMPDVDQRRRTDSVNNIMGLPNDGNMYCVPTSDFNILAYLANHGFPNVFPTPGDWSVSPPDPGYNLASSDLFTLGLFMMTDPVNGTFGDPAKFVMQATLDAAYPGTFAVTLDFAHDFYSPLFTHIAKQAISGSLVQLGIGWYANDGSDQFKLREGGHCTTLVHGEAKGGAPTMGMNDPANAEHPTNFFAQAPFTEDDYTITDVAANYGYVDDSSGISIAYFWSRTQSVIDSYGSGIIDGAQYTRAKFAFSIPIETPEVIWINPIDIVSHNFDTGPERSFRLESHPADIAINPTRTEHPYIPGGLNEIRMLDMLTGETRHFADVRLPRRLVLGGRNLDLYVLKDEGLVLFPMGGGRLDMPLRDPLAAIAFDDRTNALVGFSKRSLKLYFFDPQTLEVRRSVQVPPPCRGNVDMSITRGGAILTHCDGSDDVRRITFSDGRPRFETVKLQGVQNPIGFYGDERGVLFVSDGGVIKVFDPSGSPVTNNLFAGLPAGRSLQILRPFSNFDPAVHMTKSYFNVLPEDAVNNGR